MVDVPPFGDLRRMRGDGEGGGGIEVDQHPVVLQLPELRLYVLKNLRVFAIGPDRVKRVIGGDVGGDSAVCRREDHLAAGRSGNPANPDEGSAIIGPLRAKLFHFEVRVGEQVKSYFAHAIGGGEEDGPIDPHQAGAANFHSRP